MATQNLIIPEIYGQMVTEKLKGRVKILGLADSLGYLANTNVGQEVVFPRFKAVGSANDVVKGTPVVAEQLDQDSSKATIKQVEKTIRIYDIDDMTALGNFIENGTMQSADRIARKLDADLCIEAQKSPLASKASGAKTLTNNDLIGAFALYGDEQDYSDFAAIVINSSLISSFYNMTEFVDNTKSFVNANSGYMNKGQIGYYRNIPVIVSDGSNTFDTTKGEAISYIIKKGSLGYMLKRDLTVTLDREEKLFATDVISSQIYAVKLLTDSGIVVVKNSVV